jgi:hypothetical protein
MDAVKMAEAADVIGKVERQLQLQPAGCPVPSPSASSSASSSSSSSSSSSAASAATATATATATAAQCPVARKGSIVLPHGSTFDGAARVLTPSFTPSFTPSVHPTNTTTATTAKPGGGGGGRGGSGGGGGGDGDDDVLVVDARSLSEAALLGDDVLVVDARSLLRFSACGFEDAASAIDFNQRVVDLLFLGQYSFCGEERNPNVDVMLRTARAQGLPEEPLLLKRRNCTGQVGSPL